MDTDVQLWFQVLGPLRGSRAGAELDLGAPQQRTVLAVLLAAAGEPVAFSTIVDVLWGDAPPPTAAATVQQYMSRLRRIMEPPRPDDGPAGTIRRSPAGYALAVPGDGVDLLRWRSVVRRAREAAKQGQAEPAATGYASALALWSGPALGDLAPEIRQHPVFVHLDREHVTVLTEAADLALAAGMGAQLVPALERAAAWHPFDEGLHARLLRALAVAGQRADALQRYRKLWHRFVEELGIEPGPLLQATQQMLLAEPEAQPVLAPAAEPAQPEQPRPAQLPADLRAFSGRDAELDRLDGLTNSGAPLVVVTGLGGVGKTSLALRWAHRASSEYPDGQLYVDLRGFVPRNPPLEPLEALHGFLEALGVPRTNQPSTVEAMAALYRSVLAGRRVLVVLDNAHDEEQVRPLLPGAEGCAVVVTSRSYLGGLVVEEGARSMGLNVFSHDDAYRYLRSRLGKARVDGEPEAAAEVIQMCGGLPLALAICAAWAERSPAFTLAAVVAEIRRRDGLDAFAGIAHGRDVRAVFSWSYRRLSAEAAALFRRLGRHPGADASLATAISLGGHSCAATLEQLNELTNAQLLAEVRPGRYNMHDLVRAYAAELGDEDERSETLRRTLDHYLHSVIAAAELVNPLRESVDVPPVTEGVTPCLPANRADALTWFDDEHDNLRAVLDLAEKEGFDEYVWLFCWGLNAVLMDQLGRWDEVISIVRRALKAAEWQNAVWWCGYLHNALGVCFEALGEYEQAYRQWEMVAGLGRKAHDPLRTTGALLGMAKSLVNLDAWPAGAEIERAAQLGDEAMAILTELERTALADHPPICTIRTREYTTIAASFSAIRLLHRTGDAGAAVAELKHVIESHRVWGNWRAEQGLWGVIARIHDHVGDGPAAIEAYERAYALRHDDEWTSVSLLVDMATCHARYGNHDAAARIRASALRRMDGVYHVHADRLRARLNASTSEVE